MKFLGIAAVVLGFSSPGFAVDNETSLQQSEWRDNFAAGKKELAAGGAAFFSPAGSLSGRPTINYAGGLAHFGYMLHDPTELGSWKGNFEGLVEGYGAGIFQGRGSYMAGTTLWLRYNFVPPSGRLVPFFQGGAGMTLTDADRNVLGQDFNFNLNLGIGVRCFVTERCSVNAELRYQHISNAGMSEENLGIDAQGGVLSVSWFF